MARRRFYGWFVVAVAWVLYGFGISPAYYSWGFFTPEIIDDLSLTRAQAGYIFGLFVFLYSGVGPITGMAISRWGIRRVITAGAALAAVGLFLVSTIQTALEGFIYYAVLGGIGIGLSTILPSQTLATNWFIKYRARAIAIILIAGGVVGQFVPFVDRWMIENHGWRTGWVVIAGISLAMAVIAALFVRDAPEPMGQHPDGIDPDDAESLSMVAQSRTGPEWSVGDALRTRQFAILCLAGISFGLPWTVVVQHGRLHLQDLGMDASAAGIIGMMILVSIAGRLAGSLGDFVKPQVVFGAALALEGAGVSGLLFATSEAAAYASTVAIGLGFGAAYISSAVTFGEFFGRRAFATTNGIRGLIGGAVNAVAPGLAGAVFDSTGSYGPAFLTLVVITFVGAAAVTFSARPVPAVAAAV